MLRMLRHRMPSFHGVVHSSWADIMHPLSLLAVSYLQNSVREALLEISFPCYALPAYVINPLRYVQRIPSLTAGNDVH